MIAIRSTVCKAIASIDVNASSSAPKLERRLYNAGWPNMQGQEARRSHEPGIRLDADIGIEVVVRGV